MVKTLPFHCRGCRFKPLVRELRSCRHSVAKREKTKQPINLVPSLPRSEPCPV